VKVFGGCLCTIRTTETQKPNPNFGGYPDLGFLRRLFGYLYCFGCPSLLLTKAGLNLTRTERLFVLLLTKTELIPYEDVFAFSSVAYEDMSYIAKVR